MKAEITFSQLWWNNSLMNFFFRQQARETLEELIERAENHRVAHERIEDYSENIDNLDEFEEMCYDMTVEELAEEMGIELDEDEDEEDEDED